MDGINPDAQRVLIQVLATWVLFAVFALSAVAFVLVIFGTLKPDKATKAFLFGVFSVSSVGLLVAAATDFLRVDPKKATQAITRDSERERAAAQTRAGSSAPSGGNKITIYTQIGKSVDLPQYTALKATLAGSRFIVSAPEVVDKSISRSEIRYCNSANAADATELKALLESKGFNQLRVAQINSCDPEKNKNVAEIWLQSSQPQ